MTCQPDSRVADSEFHSPGKRVFSSSRFPKLSVGKLKSTAAMQLDLADSVELSAGCRYAGHWIASWRRNTDLPLARTSRKMPNTLLRLLHGLPHLLPRVTDLSLLRFRVSATLRWRCDYGLSCQFRTTWRRCSNQLITLGSFSLPLGQSHRSLTILSFGQPQRCLTVSIRCCKLHWRWAQTTPRQSFQSGLPPGSPLSFWHHGSALERGWHACGPSPEATQSFRCGYGIVASIGTRL